MKTNFTKLLSLFCALVMVLGIMPFGAFAETKDMTAQISDTQGIYDVSLSVPGEVDQLGVDIVYIMAGSVTKESADSSVKISNLKAAIKEVVETGTTVNFGIVTYSYEVGPILPLTPIKTLEDVENFTTTIADAFAKLEDENYNYRANDNLENALINAKNMLSVSTLADHPERQHIIVYATGHLYEFNGGENNEYASCAPVYETGSKTMYWSGSHWAYLRNGGSASMSSSSSSKNYRIPDAWGNWETYWENIEQWVAADKIDEANGNPHVFHYGLASNPVSSGSFSSLSAAEKEDFPNMTKKAGTANTNATAVMYERAWYETYEYAKKNIIDAGINLHPFFSGSSYITNGYNGYQYVGHSFMNMLAGGEAPIYNSADPLFFAPVTEKLLYTCAKDSTVENYLGYVDGENGYNFDFEVDGTITLTVGSVSYTTTKLATPVEGATASYEFSATEGGEATFRLDYYAGNGTTEEKFELYIGESVSLANPMTLNYQVELLNAADTAALKTVDDHLYVSSLTNRPTLHPVDSDGNKGEDKELNVPYVINWAAKEIEIDNAEHFVEFADVANGKNPFFGGKVHTFENQTIKLTNDIDLGDYWWYFYDDENNDGVFEFVDHRIYSFWGTLDAAKPDGNGNYTIYNMKYHAPYGRNADKDVTGVDYPGKWRNGSYLVLGLFVHIAGEVKNLNITNIGGYYNADHTALKAAEAGERTCFFALAYKLHGGTVMNVTADYNEIGFNFHNNGGDLYTSFNGLLGPVSWDSIYSGAGRQNDESKAYVKGCTVKNAVATINGDCAYAGGGFAYKASEMALFEDCHVENFKITITGNVDNYGGFIGEIGNGSYAVNCSVTGFELTAAQNNAGVGGFMGDTVGGNGWDTTYLVGCSVSDSKITIDNLNAPIGGFVGDLIGGRTTKFDNTVEIKGVVDNNGNPKVSGTVVADGYSNTVANDVILTVNSTTTSYGVGGFVGGLTGRKDLQANSEHYFHNCVTYAQINTNGVTAAGFVAAIEYNPAKQMRVVFEDCHAEATLNAENGAKIMEFGFYEAEGEDKFDIGTKGVDKNYDEYINCTTGNKIEAGVQSVAADQSTIISGYAFFSRTLSSGYVELTDITDDGTIYSTWQDPSASAVENEKTVNVEFYRKNEQGEFELWRTIQLFKDTAFDGTGYPYAATYADYRIAGGLATVLAEADDLFTNAIPVGFVDENGDAFTNSTIVGSDIKLYAEYGYNVTYKFEGEIPENYEELLPETQTYKVGEKVEIAAEPFVRGYEFLGWSVTSSFIMGEEHVEIVGTWREGFRPATVYVRGEGKDGYSYVLTEKNTGSVVATAECEDGSFSFKMECAYEGMPRYYIEEVDANGAKTGEKLMIAIRCYEGKKSYVAQVTVFAAESIDFN